MRGYQVVHLGGMIEKVRENCESLFVIITKRHYATPFVGVRSLGGRLWWGLAPFPHFRVIIIFTLVRSLCRKYIIPLYMRAESVLLRYTTCLLRGISREGGYNFVPVYKLYTPPLSILMLTHPHRGALS